MTLLFSEADEREESDGGAMPISLVEIQDTDKELPVIYQALFTLNSMSGFSQRECVLSAKNRLSSLTRSRHSNDRSVAGFGNRGAILSEAAFVNDGRLHNY